MKIKTCVLLCLLYLVFLPSNIFAQLTLLDSPARLTGESLDQVQTDNPHFKIIFQAECKRSSIKNIGGKKFFIAQKDGYWIMADGDGKLLIKPGKLKVEKVGGSDSWPKLNQPEFRSDEYGTFQILENGKVKYIFIDIHGNRVLKSSFAHASAFKNGIARVKGADGNKWWFIDTKGRAVSQKYKGLFKMADKRAVFFKNDDKLYGILDDSFKVITTPRYKRTGGFSESSDLTYVQMPDGLFGFVDKTGKMVIPAKYTAAGIFHSNIAVVSLETKEKDKDQAYFFIDQAGNPLFNGLKIYTMDYFHGNIAKVKIKVDVETCSKVNQKLLRYGAINTKGETVIPFIFNSLDEPNDHKNTLKASYYPGYKVNKSGECDPEKSINIGVSRDGKFYRKNSVKLPKLVGPDAKFYEKLSLMEGTKTADKKKRYGLSYYYNNEKEKVFIKPQFERLSHLKGPYYKFRVAKKEGLIKIIE